MEAKMLLWLRINYLAFWEYCVTLHPKIDKPQNMSTTALMKLFDLLTSTLTPNNMQWLGEQLMEQAKHDEENLKPYTVEELLERAEEGRKQIAMGNYTDFDDMIRELDRDFEEDNSFVGVEELQLETA